ncbi:accessory Sec system glycosyltransferase GtfA [Streptococcus oricebi]|uniref:UDP-N-acetylglucosamine--peptide N-acetylglucosaminyltransferase GtfA subunit n=1 Tax=Streptococcus oricebi TaxID=1547447 RepID=A0ABS5B2R0_9STRE|nr:accessory Sec system glycosyltransferase GtfA [Streptococcus oricebi]MBP2622971.1 accessory Sec system glycosyltransferase GtfA [Streptococcus oricebi]
MTIYNINLGIGWASSGVEYAQAYRAGLLRRLKEPAKFIFTDLILADNIQHLTQNIGFEDEEVIWLYNHFTDVKLAPTSYRLDKVLSSIEGQYETKEEQGKIVRYFYPQQDFFITCYLKEEGKDLVEQVDYVSQGRLIRKDYFSYVRYASEYFAPKDNQAQVYQRRFYHEDGRLAYEVLVDQGEEQIFRFPDRIFYSKPEFIRYFLQDLNWTPSDLVLLDRETGLGQVVFEEAQEAKLGVVIHAEHFSPNASNQDYILWNNYYDYQFTHADQVDFFIVATQGQKELLEEQFAHYYGKKPQVYRIPVGSLDALQPSQERQPFSMITASRLASEKHLDWLVKATIEAQKTLPDLTLDIYGSGGEEAKLKQLIEKGQAGSFIHLRGHADLTQIYARYQLYLTASTSEGFGLTLMEAIGSGLPLIGFDVRYGNQSFILDRENGYLLESSSDHIEEQIVSAFAQKITEFFQENQASSMSEKSYDLAQNYLTSRVQELWANLIKEVLDA